VEQQQKKANHPFAKEHRHPKLHFFGVQNAVFPIKIHRGKPSGATTIDAGQRSH